MAFVWFLGLLVILPFVLIIIGIALLFSSDDAKRKKGRNLAIGGVLLLLVEILIGYSICSNIHIGGGMH